MAMSKAGMKSDIITKLQACNVNLDANSIAIIEVCLEAFCDGVITHITTNMEITTIVSIPNAQPGVTTLPGTGVENTIL